MENLVTPMRLETAFRGRSVLITGHTGFKGSWLAEWLLMLGARVTGIALPAASHATLFSQLQLAPRLDHLTGDLREPEPVRQAVARAQPDYIFHLAAQPLVRESYADPVGTYASNVMGTVHLLEAVRQNRRPCTVVAITTDKCYENREWLHGYREEDPLGGHDPYSSSKAAAELVVAAYRRSFFHQSAIRLASARAGNVIGGGDWAPDRIVPDCIRALAQGQPVPVRNKVSTRPWQHVLEPLSGYLSLAAMLGETTAAPTPAPQTTYESAFNFGPALDSNRTVAELVEAMLRHWPGRWEDRSDPHALHESKLLNLATDKAHHLLGWSPVWGFEETVRQTVSWYRQVQNAPESALALTRQQIQTYIQTARDTGLAWAQPVTSPHDQDAR